uniref:ubiquitin carboxyl-terminal hydrolase 47-like isoform X1 n=1 Tax=Pristiophorus japonicus TaxID=55135 RepID=UPI00398F5C31
MLVKCLSPVATQSTVAYELFAICEHLGEYGNGHYVSRIKSCTNKWYCFNDSKVTEINSDFTRQKETDNASNGFHVSSSTAYVLMYRRKDQNTNSATNNLSSARKGQHSGLESCPSQLPIPLYVQPMEGQDGKKVIKSTQVETHHWNQSLSCGELPGCPNRN